MPSKIEWTNETWNPLAGCTKVSPGCAHCYAERMAKRLRAMGVSLYQDVVDDAGRWTGYVNLSTRALQIPMRWRKPRLIFVNSMSDLFHPAVPDKFIYKVLRVIGEARWHTFQILTKRASRMEDFFKYSPDGIPVNCWVGVSVENQKTADQRMPHLARIPTPNRFVSMEPMLDAISLPYIDKLSWLICGGESGPGARPLQPEWVRDIREQCARADVPFFFKQWGGRDKKATGRLLDGRTYDGMPARMVKP